MKTRREFFGVLAAIAVPSKWTPPPTKWITRERVTAAAWRQPDYVHTVELPTELEPGYVIELANEQLQFCDSLHPARDTGEATLRALSELADRAASRVENRGFCHTETPVLTTENPRETSSFAKCDELESPRGESRNCCLATVSRRRSSGDDIGRPSDPAATSPPDCVAHLLRRGPADSPEISTGTTKRKDAVSIEPGRV